MRTKEKVIRSDHQVFGGRCLTRQPLPYDTVDFEKEHVTASLSYEAATESN
jgi:hypothetical protein